MSTFSYQVIKDTNQKAVIKLTGQFTDGTQEANTARIQANTLYGALDANGNFLVSGNTSLDYYGLEISKVWYDVNVSGGHVSLFWSGNGGGVNNSPILVTSKTGNWNEHGSYSNITNNAVDPNGDIGIETVGASANSSYSIIIELRKDNSTYSRGQLEEPAAFNYGRFGVTP